MDTKISMLTQSPQEKPEISEVSAEEPNQLDWEFSTLLSRFLTVLRSLKDSELQLDSRERLLSSKASEMSVIGLLNSSLRQVRNLSESLSTMDLSITLRASTLMTLTHSNRNQRLEE